MKKYLVLFHFALFAYYFSTAQTNDSIRYKYTNQTIYRYGSSFLKGNERLTFRDLSKEFTMSDLGLASYTKAKNYRTTSTILRYASMLFSFTAISIAANNGNRNTAIAFIGGEFALLYAGMTYNQLSQKSLDRALWQRNKDLLFPGR
jgi:hypothetical protein